jgi:hypothetical protein
MSKEDALHWSPANQSLADTAEIIYKLFATPAGEEQKLQIASCIQDFCFAFNYKDRYIEEASIINLKKLVQNHYGVLEYIDAEKQNQIAQMLYRKFPKNSTFVTLMRHRTEEELKGKRDTVELCLERMMCCIQHAREQVARASLYLAHESFFSDEKKVDEKNQGISKEPDEDMIIGSQTPLLKSDDESESDGDSVNTPLQTIDSACHSPPQKKCVIRCNTCGKFNHHRSYCRFFENPLCNNTHMNWVDSPMGKIWRAAGHDCFKIGVNIPDYGRAEYSNNKMPKGYVYPIAKKKRVKWNKMIEN